MELKIIPLLDNFETTLAQEWNWQIWKMKVDDLPSVPVDWNWKFVWWFTTYVIVNPDKINYQLAEIDGYDKVEKTLNVINVNLQKWLDVNYTASTHNQKSIVRISNNFAFWKKIAEVVNSKQDYWIWKISGKSEYIIEVEWWVLKFKDKDNTLISLTDIAGKIWQDKKVSIDWDDEATFLRRKLWTWFNVTWNGDNKRINVAIKEWDWSLDWIEFWREQNLILLNNEGEIKSTSTNQIIEKFDDHNGRIWALEDPHITTVSQDVTFLDSSEEQEFNFSHSHWRIPRMMYVYWIWFGWIWFKWWKQAWSRNLLWRGWVWNWNIYNYYQDYRDRGRFTVTEVTKNNIKINIINNSPNWRENQTLSFLLIW